MPVFTIETTYRLPVYRQRSYEAATLTEACRLAVADDDWDSAKHDEKTAGATYVTGVWDGRNTDDSGPPVPVPSRYRNVFQRKADHFEVLLGLVKVLCGPDGSSDRTYWRERAAAAVAKAEAILAGAPDPD